MGPNLQSKVNGGGWVGYWDKLWTSIRKLLAYFRLENCANLGFLVKLIKFGEFGSKFGYLAKFRPNSIDFRTYLDFRVFGAAGVPLRPADPEISL